MEALETGLPCLPPMGLPRFAGTPSPLASLVGDKACRLVAGTRTITVNGIHDHLSDLLCMYARVVRVVMP